MPTNREIVFDADYYSERFDDLPPDRKRAALASEYSRFARKYWDMGYQTSIEDICSLLGITRNYIYTLLADCKCIRYTKSWLIGHFQKTGRLQVAEEELRSVRIPRVYYNLKEIDAAIQKQAAFTRQTRLTDFFEHYQADPSRIPKEEVLSHFDSYRHAPDAWICSLYQVSYEPIQFRTRSLYPHVPVRPVSILDERYRIIVPKTYGAEHGMNSELIYRTAILNGWIKVAVTGSKTIFLEEIHKSKTSIVLPAEEEDPSLEGEGDHS